MDGFRYAVAATSFEIKAFRLKAGARRLMSARPSFRKQITRFWSLVCLVQSKNNCHDDTCDTDHERQPRLLLFVLYKEGLDCGRKD